MAASGINEHSEARRLQRVVNKRAYYIKKMMEEMRDNPDGYQGYEPPAERPQTTYQEELSSCHMRKMGSPPGIGNHQAPIIDKLRRDQIREQQQQGYSAKIPNRLTSKDYTQQW